MKNVILITEHYAPNNTIGSIRWTKISKYLSNHFDYNFYIVTKKLDNDSIIDPILKSDLLNIRIKQIITIPKKFKAKTSSVEKKSDKKNNIEWIKYLKRNIRKFIEILSGYKYLNKARKSLLKTNLKFDIIISSYGPYSSHLIGNYLKKRNKKAIWIADFRDPVYNPFLSKTLFSIYDKNFSKRICKNADIITAVSEGCFTDDNLKAKKNVEIISNGFDPSDLKNVKKSKSNEQITITYVGNLYNGLRDLTPFFSALAQLIDSKLIDKNKLFIQYAGRSYREFMDQASLLNDSVKITYHGYVNRNESLDLLNSSDILLLSSWNNKQSTGVITGKFYEYLMFKKPILCFISGDLENSDLKHMINQAKVGFCYEEAMQKTDFENLKIYMHNLYNSIINNEVFIKPNIKYIDQFDYNKISSIVHELLVKNQK